MMLAAASSAPKMGAFITSAVILATDTSKTIIANLSAAVASTADCKTALRIAGATDAHTLGSSTCTLSANSSTMSITLASGDTAAFAAAAVGEWDVRT